MLTLSPVGRVPISASGTTGAPRVDREPRRPTAEARRVPRTPRALGEHADDATALQHGAAAGERLAPALRTPRSARTRAGSPPSTVTNISVLTSKWAERGVTPTATGPSMNPTWFAMTITGPLRGTLFLPATFVLHSTCASSQPTGRPQRVPSRLEASRVRPDSRARLLGEVDDGLDGLVDRQVRRVQGDHAVGRRLEVHDRRVLVVPVDNARAEPRDSGVRRPRPRGAPRAPRRPRSSVRARRRPARRPS